MKTIAKMIAIVILLGAGTWLTAKTAQAHRGFDVYYFYNDLRPYGTWVETPEYGTVWIPDVAPGFQPYATSGYWTYTFYGWTWVSYYSWGWAPFHYGRWYLDPRFGWAWVPDYEWGPGWVTWRHCDGYYGWAPLTPGFHVTVNVNVHIDIPAPYWTFVPHRHFGRHDMDRYYTGSAENERLYHHSRTLAGTTADRETSARYFKGPEVNEARKATGRDFRPVEVREASKPGQTVRDGRMEVYRPEKRTESQARYDRKPAGEQPARYENKPLERQAQVNNTPRNEGSYNRNSRPQARPEAAPSRTTEQKNYTRPGNVRPEMNAKPAEKKTTPQRSVQEQHKNPASPKTVNKQQNNPAPKGGKNGAKDIAGRMK